MQATVRLINKIVEDLCPPVMAEEWDNCGLQAGDPEAPVHSVLLALDLDGEVLTEARAKGAGLIITHHPLMLKGVRQIREDRPQGRLLAQIIRSGIAIYAAHTNLDSASGGVNDALARRLGLSGVGVLRPGREKYLKLAVFVPAGHAGAVRQAVAGAGAGWIGNYSECAFMTRGTGSFRPLEGTSPYIGRVGDLEEVEEIRLETIVPESLSGRVVNAMLAAHPYEEVAYDLYPLENGPKNSGLGRVGDLGEEVPLGQLTLMVKEALGIKAVRAGGPRDRMVARVAVCGGSGSDLWPLALACGAQVLVTGDVGYHAARDMLAAGLCFIDAGHYGTERVILDPLADYLKARCEEKGLDVKILASEVNGDPFTYA